MKYAWLTDIHLNFIDDIVRQKFYQEIVNTECTGVLITGDIAEAPCLADIYPLHFKMRTLANVEFENYQ